MGEKNKVASGLMYQLIQRFGVALVQFLISTILARLLLPEEYGVISLIMAFIAISTLLVDAGLGTAIIQKKDLQEDDCSSVLWVQLFFALVLYAALYIAAPYIAAFYRQPLIVNALRLYGILLFPTAINGIYSAMLMKELQFKKIMFCNVIPLCVAGAIGILVAFLGGGIYSLIIQAVLNAFLSMVFFVISLKWIPKFVFTSKRVWPMLSFSGKLLLANLIDMGYRDLYPLIIPRVFGTAPLAYYTYGRQIPNVLTTSINASTIGVVYPLFSKFQNDQEKVISTLRNAIRMSSFIIFPLTAGMAVLSNQIIYLLLGSKWLPAAFYLSIFCITHGLFHLQSLNFQALSATGRSDIFLKYEIYKKTLGVIVLVVTVPLGMKAIMVGHLLLSFIYILLGIYPNTKYLNYNWKQQIADYISPFMMSIAMMVLVWAVLIPLQNYSVFTQTIAGVLVGAAAYIGLAIVSKNKEMSALLATLKKAKTKK